MIRRCSRICAFLTTLVVLVGEASAQDRTPPQSSWNVVVCFAITMAAGVAILLAVKYGWIGIKFLQTKRAEKRAR